MGLGVDSASTGVLCAESGGEVYNQTKAAFTYQKKDEWISGKKKTIDNFAHFMDTSILPHD